MTTKKIGLLLGDEEDWPCVFEALVERLGSAVKYKGQTHHIETSRIRIHPFSLDAPTTYDLVIDRLAYWHYNPREWLKKAALVNDVYLLNNPYSFQSMEKHTAYCAMIRLGFKIPETWLIPTKIGPQSRKYSYTAKKYHDFFSLEKIAREIGYPLYMKPFDGGGWRGVTKIENEHELMQAYKISGKTLMHLQAGLDNYDVFVRSLAIGPQVICIHYDPSQPLHARYVIDHSFLSSEHGKEAERSVKLINALFRWDFNSCESIIKNNTMWLIDFANACPDIAITSLHYYFPWAIKALLAWSFFCVVTNRHMHISMDFDRYIKIGDSERTRKEKLAEYEKLADQHFETERFEEFRAQNLKNLDEIMWELAQTRLFDDILTRTVISFFPPHEHDEFIAHFRGLLKSWVDSEASNGTR
jgi:hypothetical protein